MKKKIINDYLIIPFQYVLFFCTVIYLLSFFLPIQLSTLSSIFIAKREPEFVEELSRGVYNNAK